MTTIYEVSKAAGVSLATVSRVINGTVKVSDNTREKVNRAMQELGYQPNAIAQSLASKRSNSVGLLVSELAGPFFGKMISSVEDELRHAGKHVIITAGHSDEEKEKAAIEFLLSRRCDALILQVEAVSDEYLIGLKQRGVAFALINHSIEEIAEQCFVLDNESAGFVAATAAIEQGHKRIAYITGPGFKEDAMLRLRGHKKALQAAGIAIDEELIYQGDYHEHGGIQGFHTLYQRDPSFSVLICANDEMASGAMKAARDTGVRIPEQLSVIGFDDAIFAKYVYPSLTTVLNPVSEMGSMATRWVLKNTYQQKTVKDIRNVFHPTLVARESLGQFND